MVAVLVILDGAGEPWRGAPTRLERARTPVLDRLAREGELTRLRTIAAGLATGFETAIPALLGWTPTERAVARLPIVELASAAALVAA